MAARTKKRVETIVLKYLLDSNIIIYHLNGDSAATRFITENIEFSAISRISYIEILSFDFTLEQELEVTAFLEDFKIIDTSNAIAKQAIKNRKNKKIKVPDNIILSTAQTNNLTLVTKNVSDFEFAGIEILNIFETA